MQSLRPGQDQRSCLMLRPIKIPSRGLLPRLLLLDHVDQDGEPRAALIRPGKMPTIYPNLARAVDALRAEVTP